MSEFKDNVGLKRFDYLPVVAESVRKTTMTIEEDNLSELA